MADLLCSLMRKVGPLDYYYSSSNISSLLSQTIKAKALRRCRTLYQVDIELQLDGLLRFCPVLHAVETYYVIIMHGIK